MDESCISWATVASLISIFTDPPAQHPSKLFKQLGRRKTDSWRKGIFRFCRMLCSQDPWLQRIKQIWDEGRRWQIRQLLLRTAGKPQPLSRMASRRCQMCAPTVRLETLWGPAWSGHICKRVAGLTASVELKCATRWRDLFISWQASTNSLQDFQ